MNPQKPQAACRKRLLLFFILFPASVLSVSATLAPSFAQSAEEREMEITIPKHLPIKVRMKEEKEKAFKDLKNEKWLRDFELEITNTGDKPIYFLSLSITLPEIIAPYQIGPDVNKMGFSIHYGRGQLIDIETKPWPDETPIKPGETYVFSFPAREQVDWDRFRKKEKKPDAKKLILSFQALSFGDGTGFIGNDGMAVPHGPDN
jgi:hypothetical protein